MPVWVTGWNVSPREDGFPSGSALGETFYHVTHTALAWHICIIAIALGMGSLGRISCTGELGYDGPLYDGFLHMTYDMLGPSSMHIKYSSYVYDGFCI